MSTLNISNNAIDALKYFHQNIKISAHTVLYLFRVQLAFKQRHAENRWTLETLSAAYVSP